jgi:DNA-binding response OmpR family regulator/uncharacterized protein YbaR (Trm112 family)
MQTEVAEDSGVPPIVLVVEDDPDTRELYDIALSSAGMWVSQAPQAGAAFEAALELQPDAVITDLELEGSSGVDLLRQLRADGRTREIPVIVITGWNADSVPDRREFAAVLFKPIGIEQLISNVRSVLGHSKALRERSQRATARIPDLIDRSKHAIDRSHRTLSKLVSTLNDVRTCPSCKQPLRYIETRKLDDIDYEYFHPCSNGCGLFCYDRERRRMVSLY